MLELNQTGAWNPPPQKPWISAFGVLIPLSFLACGAAHQAPQAAQAPAQETAEKEEKAPAQSELSVQALFERELTQISREAVAAPGGDWKGEIEATSRPEVKRGETHIGFAVNVGDAGRVDCFVYPQQIDAGTAVLHMLKAAAASPQQIEFKQIAPYHLEVVEHAPVLFVRAIYHTAVDGETAAGDFKIAVSPRPEYPVVCTHDTPGYAKSFARITTGFIESLTHQSSLREPARGEVWVTSVNDVPIGFSSWNVYEERDGTSTSVSIEATVLPMDQGVLTAKDRAEVLSFDKHGRLLKGTFMALENLEPALEVELTQQKPGEYHYEGRVRGKDVNGDFKVEGGLSGSVPLFRRIKALQQKKQESRFTVKEYLPATNPSGATSVEYEFVPGTAGAQLFARTGQMKAELATDSRGIATAMKIDLESVALLSKLVDERGDL